MFGKMCHPEPQGRRILNSRFFAAFRMTRAFTLIEILLVVVILLIIVGVSAPNFSPVIKSLELKQAANDLAYLMRYAQSRSIVQNKILRLYFSDERDSYWLMQGKPEENIDAPPSKEVSEGVSPKLFERFAGRYGKSFHVSNRVVMKGKADHIDFLPDGRISKEEVELCSEAHCFIVTTKGYRGKVNVVELAS